MSPEEQRIAIAEACGWRLKWQNQGGALLLETKPQGHCWEVWFNPDRRTINSQGHEVYPPNYLSNLNEMRLVQETLTNPEWPRYLAELNGFSNADEWWADMSDLDKLDAMRVIASSTAKEKAEAFLKVKGLWRE